jgi:tetratricopeptide (TPR) repeat protein
MLARDNVNWGLVIRHAGAAAPRDSVDLSGWQATWAQVRDAAREAADKAITLGPELADSHAAKAEVLALLDWNWNAAQAEYQRALQIERNNASIIELAADIPMFLGRLPECLQLARRAAALDPLGHAWATIGFAEQFSGNLNEAAQAFHKSIELYPDGVMVHFRYASALLEQGNTQAALTEFEQESLVPARYIGKAMALDALGRRSEAEAAIAFAEEKWGDAMSYQISYFYAARNDRDRAFAWLERAYRQHDGGLLNLKVDSRFRNLRQDPRYTQLLRRMNLLE